MTEAETNKLVYVMLAATGQGGKHDTKAVGVMVDAYHALLSDLDYARCNAAVRVLLSSSKWMPAVAEIRAAVLELEGGPVRSGEEAWKELQGLLSRYGFYRSPGADFSFDDPVMARCVDAAYWRELCNGTDDSKMSDRARFIALYNTHTQRERLERQVPLLAQARELRERGELASAGDLVAGLLARAKEEHEPKDPKAK